MAARYFLTYKWRLKKDRSIKNSWSGEMTARLTHNTLREAESEATKLLEQNTNPNDKNEYADVCVWGTVSAVKLNLHLHTEIIRERF